MKHHNKLYDIDDNTPKQSDEHVIHLKKQVDKTFDEHYNFIATNPLKKFSDAVLWWFAVSVLNVVAFFKHGLRIKNRQITRRLQKEKKGYVSISNHNLILDCYAGIKANGGHKTHIPTVEETMKIPGIRIILKGLGVMPIPAANPKGLVKFKEAVNTLLQQGKRVHFYPEGALWPYYKKLREFKSGAFRFAVDNNVPIVPFCIYFRDRKGIWKLLGKKPLVTLEILDPIYPDESMAKKQAINAIMNESFCKMKTVIDSHYMDTNVYELKEQTEMQNLLAEIEANSVNSALCLN